MIAIDSSVLLCLITVSSTPDDVRMKERARSLFSGVEDGTIRATIAEVVLHEFCYVSGSKRLNRLSVQEQCGFLRSLLEWPGWVFATGEKSMYHRAIDILERDPKLEFSDSVIAARAEAWDAKLATFDTRLARAYSGSGWQ